ncbi:MAG TPA: methyltransferase [Caulobacteraceae bacterium]|nr:methyltransferase [Caulobacteraceae bacterium]
MSGKRFETVLGDDKLRFETSPGLFSPQGPDAGTVAMLARVDLQPGMKLLDLGCGWGLVGAWAAMRTDPALVWMVDSDPAAVACAKANLKLNGVEGAHVLVSDGLSAVDETGFDLILSNPPYHADFAVPKAFIEKGFNRLKLGGTLWMVTRREAWHRNRLTAIFGGCRVHRDGGYFVFEAVKKRATYANR